MTDKRPAELTRYIVSTAEKNDSLILDALTKIEAQLSHGKLKPTVASVCVLTGLSRNSVRNRSWALDRLKLLRQKKRMGRDKKGQGASKIDGDEEEVILDRLRRRVTSLLEQNALFYEEILALRRIIEKKDTEIQALATSRLRCV